MNGTRSSYIRSMCGDASLSNPLVGCAKASFAAAFALTCVCSSRSGSAPTSNVVVALEEEAMRLRAQRQTNFRQTQQDEVLAICEMLSWSSVPVYQHGG